MLFITTIGICVCYMLYYIVTSFEKSINPTAIKFSHSSILEIIWTLVPAISLIFIAIPSFSLLYSLDELLKPSLTLKIIGHQWYWSYEYSDYESTIAFDSFLVDNASLEIGDHSVYK